MENRWGNVGFETFTTPTTLGRGCDRIRGVGFNPYRKQKKRKSDVVLVVSALLLTAVLVVWALGAFN
jgi:hypothetical protein